MKIEINKEKALEIATYYVVPTFAGVCCVLALAGFTSAMSNRKRIKEIERAFNHNVDVTNSVFRDVDALIAMHTQR